MLKSEAEQILIIIKAGQEEALNMKIYKDGTLTRRGCGGIPEIGISAMTFTEDPEIFDNLMAFVPQQVLDTPVNYKDEKISNPFEYIIAFYGASKNGETGERAEWTQSTGIHFLLDSNTSFRHPLLSFADGLSIEAAQQTNSWYFDAMMLAVYKQRSKMLEETILAAPTTEEGLQNSFANYVNQMRFSGRNWDLPALAKNKVYVSGEGIESRLEVTVTEESCGFRFVAINGPLPFDL